MSSKDWNGNKCRTCLQEKDQMKFIFNSEDIESLIYKILTTCTPIQITKGDGLPQQVCLNCVQEINRIYQFQKLCEDSDIALRNYSHTLPTCNGSNTEANDVVKLEDGTNANTRISSYCNLCDKMCPNLTSSKEHIAAFHNDVFQCEHCSKQFKSKLVFTRHRFSHQIEDEDVKQNSKQNTFGTLEKKTGMTKDRWRPVTCDICEKTFRFHSNLERHKLIHTGEKPFLCNACGKRFSQLSYLKIHSFIHTGEKPYKCQTCQKLFGAPATLTAHIRTHTGERPNICNVCGKGFQQSGYLTWHMRVHTGEKPIECNVCYQRFNHRGRLNIHMRIHSGEKPYACKECGKSFAVKGTLKRHLRTHTGEKPYICSVCGQAFAQNGTLATHIKIHTLKETLQNHLIDEVS